MNALDAPKTIATPGIYSGIPFDVYLADPAPAPSLSSGGAHTLLTQSPAHAWADHPRNPARRPREDSDAMAIGTIAHELLLEGSEAQAAVIDPRDHAGVRGGIPKGWTNDAIRKARDDARAAGKIPILLADMERVREMIEVARRFIASSQIASIFDRGEAEATVIANDGDLWMRARPDWMTHERDFVVHLKTTVGTAQPAAFIRGRLFSLGYDVAVAFYEQAIALAAGKAPESCILVQEQMPPYACSLVGLDPSLADLAHRKVDHAKDLWRQCTTLGSFPAYSPRIHFAEPLPWQVAEVEAHAMTRISIDPAQVAAGFPQA